MAVKYYIKRDGRKVYATPNTLMAVQNMAQREADKIGRAVSVFGEEAGRAGRAVAKAYRRNPVKKPAKKPVTATALAYRRGKADAENGYEPSDNPYTPGTPKHKSWRLGFSKGL